MSEALKPLNARTYWEQAGGTWMGHDIGDAEKFRPSAVSSGSKGTRSPRCSNAKPSAQMTSRIW